MQAARGTKAPFIKASSHEKILTNCNVLWNHVVVSSMYDCLSRLNIPGTGSWPIGNRTTGQAQEFFFQFLSLIDKGRRAGNDADLMVRPARLSVWPTNGDIKWRNRYV